MEGRAAGRGHASSISTCQCSHYRAISDGARGPRTMHLHIQCQPKGRIRPTSRARRPGGTRPDKRILTVAAETGSGCRRRRAGSDVTLEIGNRFEISAVLSYVTRNPLETATCAASMAARLGPGHVRPLAGPSGHSARDWVQGNREPTATDHSPWGAGGRAANGSSKLARYAACGKDRVGPIMSGSVC